MTHDDWVKCTDQLEDSLTRAETARKDIDLLVVLRLAYKIAKEQTKATEPRKPKELTEQERIYGQVEYCTSGKGNNAPPT